MLPCLFTETTSGNEFFMSFKNNTMDIRIALVCSMNSKNWSSKANVVYNERGHYIVNISSYCRTMRFLCDKVFVLRLEYHMLIDCCHVYSILQRN